VDGVPFYGSLLQRCMMESGYAKSIMVLLLSLCGGVSKQMTKKMTQRVLIAALMAKAVVVSVVSVKRSVPAGTTTATTRWSAKSATE
jgi:hypothetical protein